MEFDGPADSDSDIFDRYENIIDRALGVTTDKIATLATEEVDPREAIQWGIDYIAYNSQSDIIALRQLDRHRPEGRAFRGEVGAYHNMLSQALTFSAHLLDSLTDQPDAEGFREYFKQKAEAFKKAAIMPDDSLDEVNMQLSRGFEKITGLIPDEGMMATPPMIAWMDPRFNGEGDIPQPQ